MLDRRGDRVMWRVLGSEGPVIGLSRLFCGFDVGLKTVWVLNNLMDSVLVRSKTGLRGWSVPNRELSVIARVATLRTHHPRRKPCCSTEWAGGIKVRASKSCK